ncbi:MAG TPA: hypothetical protein VK171_01555 [Fimbriimonas sp.]|nr:hypothetical protein [Fimbriimonas sp.]
MTTSHWRSRTQSYLPELSLVDCDLTRQLSYSKNNSQPPQKTIIASKAPTKTDLAIFQSIVTF